MALVLVHKEIGNKKTSERVLMLVLDRERPNTPRRKRLVGNENFLAGLVAIDGAREDLELIADAGFEIGRAHERSLQKKPRKKK